MGGQLPSQLHTPCVSTAEAATLHKSRLPVVRFYRSPAAAPHVAPHAATNRTQEMTEQEKAHAEAEKDVIKFWDKQAKSFGIKWEKKWDKVLDDKDQPIYRWFPGAQLNTAYNVRCSVISNFDFFPISVARFY